MQLAPPEAAQSPERNAQSKRERSVIARISAAEPGAQEVGPRVDSGPLSLGLSLSNPTLPPLRPINGARLFAKCCKEAVMLFLGDYFDPLRWYANSSSASVLQDVLKNNMPQQ